MTLSPEKTASLCERLLQQFGPKAQLNAACALRDEETLQFVAERSKAPHGMVLRAMYDNQCWDLMEAYLSKVKIPPRAVSAFVVDLMSKDTKHESLAGLSVLAGHIHWGSVLSRCPDLEGFKRVWALMPAEQQTAHNADLGLSKCINELSVKDLAPYIPATHTPKLVILAALGNFYSTWHGAVNRIIPELMAAYPDSFTIPSLMRVQWLVAFLPAVDMAQWGETFHQYVLQHPETPSSEYVDFLGRLFSYGRAYPHKIPVPESFSKEKDWPSIQKYCQVVKDLKKP